MLDFFRWNREDNRNFSTSAGRKWCFGPWYCYLNLTHFLTVAEVPVCGTPYWALGHFILLQCHHLDGAHSTSALGFFAQTSPTYILPCSVLEPSSERKSRLVRCRAARWSPVGCSTPTEPSPHLTTLWVPYPIIDYRTVPIYWFWPEVKSETQFLRYICDWTVLEK